MRIPVVENPRRKTRKRSTRKTRRTSKRRSTSSTSKRKTVVVMNPRRRRSRRRVHRNPSFRGLGINLSESGGIALGFGVAKYGPQLLSKFVSLPTTGITGHLTRLASVVVTSMLTKSVLKKRRMSEMIMAGGIAYVLFGLFDQYAAPSLGLSGVGDYVRMPGTRSNRRGLLGYIPSGAKAPYGPPAIVSAQTTFNTRGWRNKVVA